MRAARIRSVRAAFDGEAADYGPRGRANGFLELLKHRGRAQLLSRVPPGSLVCDAGCGPGEDAAAFAAAGRRVVALDVSPGMLRAAGRRTARWRRSGRVRLARADWARGTPGRLRGRCAAVWCWWGTNFQPDLAAFARFCDAALRPGGVAVFTSPGRHGLWETAAGLARLDPAFAFRRLSPRGVRIAFRGGPARVWAPPGRAVLEPFWRRGWAIEHREALGLILPPPFRWRPRSPRRTRLWRVLSACEAWAGRWPPLLPLADHVLVIVRKPAR